MAVVERLRVWVWTDSSGLESELTLLPLSALLPLETSCTSLSSPFPVLSLCSGLSVQDSPAWAARDQLGKCFL